MVPVVILILALSFFIISCSVQPNQPPSGDSGTSPQLPDTNLPSVVISFPVNWYITNGSPVTVSGTASIGGTNYITLVELNVNSNGFSAVTGTNNWSTNVFFNEGTNTLMARAISVNDQTNTSPEVIVIQDFIPPYVLVQSVTNFQEVGSSFELSGEIADDNTGPKKVYIKIETGSWEELAFNPSRPFAWTTNITFSAYGYHTNYLYAIDQADNTGPVKTNIVNRAAVPSVLINTPLSYMETNVGTVTISGDSSVDGANITNVLLSTNSAPYVSVATTSNFSVLWSGFGAGTNSVIAKVMADNGKSNFSATRYFVVDQTPPASPSVTGPVYTSATTPTWTWQSGGNGGNGTYRYKLDNSDLTSGATVTSGTNYTSGVLSDGNHILYVQERDNAGNWSTSGSHTIDVFTGSAIYAATTGNDTNRGTSTAPILTIQKAVDKAGALGLQNVYVAIGTYTRGSGLNTLTNGVLITNNNIKLRGGYDSGTWTRGAGDYSVLQISGVTTERVVGAISVSNILIDGFVIRGGHARFDFYTTGGGIDFKNVNGSVITNSVISNNTAPRGGGISLDTCKGNYVDAIVIMNSASNAGGGIFDTYGSNNTHSGTVSSNSVEDGFGGGISLYCAYGDSAGHKIYANVTYNTTTSTSNDHIGGGGIFVRPRNCTITGYITGNRSLGNTEGGGGIYLDENAYYTVINSPGISQNSATSNGGGIFITTIDTNTVNAVITSNTAYSGGGIYSSKNFDTTGDVSYNTAFYGGGWYINGSTGTSRNGDVHHNSAFMGGGYYLLTPQTTFALSNAVYNNYATNLGGGIFLTNANGCRIAGNIFLNSASNGGGLYHTVRLGNSTILSGNFCSNNAIYGGGIYLNNGPVSLSGSVYHNSASTNGGGVYIIDAASTISGSVYGNYARFTGGGLYLASHMGTTISGSVYSNSVTNRFPDGTAAGIYVINCTNVTVSGSVFSNRVNSALGGGLYLRYSTNTLISGGIIDNLAREGGGVYGDYTSGIVLTGVVSNNTASGGNGGGGIYCWGCTNIQIGGSIMNNTAVGGGGGLYIGWGAEMRVSNNVIISNNSTGNYGGGILFETFRNARVDCFILSNKSTGGAGLGCGGAIYSWAGTNIDVRSTNIGNSAYSGGGLYFYNGASNRISSTSYTYYNRATNYPGVALENEFNFSLYGNIISNMVTGTGINAALWLKHTGTTMTNLYLSYPDLGVGNDTGTSYVIYEDATTDIYNHTLTGIKFYTNFVDYLYHNANGTNIPFTNVSLLNTTNLMNHGASQASANGVYPY